MNKIEKNLMIICKTLGKFLVKFNDIEAVSKHIVALISR